MLGACSSRAEKAENYYKHGMEFLANKDYAKARVEFRNALQLKSDQVEAWRGLSQVDEHDNNLQGLVQDLTRITELDEKDADARVRLARLYLLGGASEKALKLADAAADLKPQDPSVYTLKATILFRLKDNDRATEQANKALAIDPTNTEALSVIAALQLRAGDAKSSLETLSKIPSKAQDQLAVLFLKADIYQKLNQKNDVENVLRRIIALHPENATFRQNLISFYVANGRLDDAEKELRTFVEKNPDDQQAELSLVQFLGQTRGIAQARSELTRRIDQGGKVFVYQIALAKLDFTQGKFDQSKTLLNTLIAHPASPDDELVARNTLAQLYLDRNDVAEAEPLVTEVLSKDSRNTDALRLRALIRLGRGQTDDAISDLRRALNDQPKSPELLSTLGAAYERSGLIELADKSFQDAMKASGYKTAYGLNYIAFLQRRGFTTQAETVLSDLVTRHPKDVAVLAAAARDRLARGDWAAVHEVADQIRLAGGDKAFADQIEAAAFAGQNKLSDTVSALSDAHQAAPNAIQPLSALVGTYLRSKQPAKADELVQSALKKNPENADFLALSGAVKLAQNDIAGAEQQYQMAIKAQPKNPIGYTALSGLYLRQGKADAAVGVIKSGLKEEPKNFSLRLSYAGLLEYGKNYDAAIAQYEDMLNDNPGSLIVINNLASLLADHKSDKASLERAANLAVALKSSQVPQFQDTLGWVDYQNGQYSPALESLQKAAEKLPNLAIVRYHLGMTYLAAGDATKAEEQLNKAKQLSANDADLSSKVDDALRKVEEKKKS
jgi:tetratricopeptide (TPR) repeat protein